MSKRFGYLVSILASLFICLAANAPSSAHEGKQGKFGPKHHSAQKSCNLESPQAWLGVLVQDLSPERSLAQDIEAGALVVSVIKGGPAEAAGVKQGDVIIAINSQPVASAQQLSDLTAKLPAGSEAQLTLFSNGKQENKTLTLAEPNFTLRHQAGKPKPQLYPGMFMEEMMGRTPLKQMSEGTLAQERGFPFSAQPGIALKERKLDYVQLFLRHRDMLELTAEQVKELKHLAYEQQKRQIKTNAEIEIAQIELEELLSEEQIDLTKVEQKIKQLEAARGAKLLFQAKALHQAQTMLTDEQRAKLKQLRRN